MDITEFIAHFGIIELSIGTALGLGFKHAVDSITRDIVKPILQAFFHTKELHKLYYTILGAKFNVGDVLLAFINFIVLILVILSIMYFFLSPLLKKILEEKTQSDKRNIEQNTKIISVLKDIRDNNIYRNPGL